MPLNHEVLYAPLHCEEEYDNHYYFAALNNRFRRATFIVTFTLSVILNILSGYRWMLYEDCAGNMLPEMLYSPARDAIEYKMIKFTRGFSDDVPMYEREPSPEVDRAWEGLYQFAMSKVPSSEAARLENSTWRILEDQGYYFTSLDIFHQLHCLDMLRQAIHPHYYADFDLPLSHIRHCVGAIRQSLMCISDVSPLVWQWSARRHKAEQRDDIVHTCRNFDKIQDWAKIHHYDGIPNFTVYIE